MPQATPRVLDLTGLGRHANVEVVATPLTDLLIGLATFQFDEAAHTLDAGPAWFDQVRTQLSAGTAAALERLGRVGWGNLLAMALADPGPTDVGTFLDRLQAMPAEELWMTLAASHLLPFAGRVDPDVFRMAAGGDADARERLLDAAREAFGDEETKTSLYLGSAEETKDLVVRSVRGWHDDVFVRTAHDVAAVLERDAAAKRRLRRSSSDEALIEAATNGLIYEAEPWVRRVVLTPHLAMRPWNVICAHDDTYVICYPVADESLGVDGGAPPARLLRLYKALGDERRLRILKLLAGRSLTLQEIADAVSLAKSSTHHHMVILRSAGLVRTALAHEGRYELRRETLPEASAWLASFLDEVRP